MGKEEVLQELGFSKNESKVFLALLSTGPVSAGVVADKTKLHRTNVYDALSRLIEKGVVSYIIAKNNTKIFEAGDPDKLVSLLKDKEKLLNNIMPQLKLEKQLSQKKTTAHVYEGVKAFQLALYNLLNYEKTIYIYGLPKHAPDMVKSFIMGFHRQRIEKKITMKHIYNENAQERIKFLNSMSYTEAKYLPEKFNTPVSTMTCGKEVLIINWQKPLTFIVIDNETLAETYQNYFDVLYTNAVMYK